MLIGEYSYNIDPKGRLNFPIKLREDLGEKFIIAKNLTDKCLNVYSLEEWDKLVAKIQSLPMAKATNVRRHIFATACDVIPDKQGRILIPQNLRSYAELSKEVMVIGVSNYCEIWNKDKWDEVCEAVDVTSLAAAVDELGI